MTTCYAAGFRIFEAVGLSLPAIDRQRMVLRVEHGKGQKDRYIRLSPALLEIVRDWWRMERPGHWLFLGDRPGHPITTHAVDVACQHALGSLPGHPRRPASRRKRSLRAANLRANPDSVRLSVSPP